LKEYITENVKEDFNWLEWLVDISWSVEIILNFFTMDDKARTFKECAKGYLMSYFVFDFLATIPSMITLQHNDAVTLLKMLRFVHVLEIFRPFRMLIDFFLPDTI